MTFYKTMIYCPNCGNQLIDKFLKDEGMIPYCSSCQTFCFPVFNTACSMIILNEKKTQTLLIRQYGMSDYILAAGYIAQGEDAEQTVCREIKEELGLTVTSLCYNASKYYEKSNSLMLNFTVTVAGQVESNCEIDDWDWFDFELARKTIKTGSLAEEFLVNYLNRLD